MCIRDRAKTVWNPSEWAYWQWLVAVSIAIALAERIRPARQKQPALRRQLGNDLFYLAFHGHWYYLLFGGLIVSVAAPVSASLDWLPQRLLDGRGFWLQFCVYLIVSDALQWCVHRLLHGVPFLWKFHQVHHSVQEMDWAANFRFHWMETVVYRSALYVPVALCLGGDYPPLLTAWVFGTAWGHFNHANLNVGIGPLKYLFNSPRMHLWHHDASDEGGTAKNFGIVFSCWDWLFGTAYWPEDRPPERIGFPGDEAMPRDLPRQLAWPLVRGRPPAQ